MYEKRKEDTFSKMAKNGQNLGPQRTLNPWELSNALNCDDTYPFQENNLV